MTRAKAWTAEEDEVLRELWEDGAETPEISEALGKSREAILHRARTLALPAHVSAPRPWTVAELNTLRRMFKTGRSDAAIAAHLDDRSVNSVEKARQRLGLRRRAEHGVQRPMQVVGPARTCQWIDGDVRSGDYSMCGRKSVEGVSYCAEHRRRCYRGAGDPPLAKKSWKDPLQVRSAQRV